MNYFPQSLKEEERYSGPASEAYFVGYPLPSEVDSHCPSPQCRRHRVPQYDILDHHATTCHTIWLRLL